MAKNKEKVNRKPGEKLKCAKCKKPITDDLWEGVEVGGVWVAAHLSDCTGKEAERLADDKLPIVGHEDLPY